MEISDQLARDLLEAHRPLVIHDSALAAPGISQYTVTCKACAENRVVIWRPNDSPVHCCIWTKALEEKLVEDNLWGSFE